MKHCELFKYIAFITFLGRTACDDTYVPHWENVECEVLEVKYPTYPPLPIITITYYYLSQEGQLQVLVAGGWAGGDLASAEVFFLLFTIGLFVVFC